MINTTKYFAYYGSSLGCSHLQLWCCQADSQTRAGVTGQLRQPAGFNWNPSQSDRPPGGVTGLPGLLVRHCRAAGEAGADSRQLPVAFHWAPNGPLTSDSWAGPCCRSAADRRTEVASGTQLKLNLGHGPGSGHSLAGWRAPTP